MRKLAILSLHTSPLAQPGSGDGGGMNVYVREVSLALSQAGVSSTVFTRRTNSKSPTVVEVEPGFEVVQVEAGDFDLPKEQLFSVVENFKEGVEKFLENDPQYDALLANYWLSGIAAHKLKHSLNLPLLTTFHTLARIKAAAGDQDFELDRRIKAEQEIIGCSDVILSNDSHELSQMVHHYGADPSRIEVISPGVDHSVFKTGSKKEARKSIGIDGSPMMLFVGRIQPLKGVDIAVQTLAALDNKNSQLVIVGGSSGLDGPEEEKYVRCLANELGLGSRVKFIPPQPHEVLADWYRAADVVVMPSRSESFGLVALEAAACGVPVVAASVGGLRTIVSHGVSGYLVRERNPFAYASYISRIINDPKKALVMSKAASERSSSFTWLATAARLRRVYSDVLSRALVDCS